MKKITLLLTLLIVVGVKAQDISLRWADKINTKKAVSILGGKNGKYFTSHKNKNQNLVFRTYNSKLNLENEKVVTFNLDDKKYSYNGAHFLGNQIVHFIGEYKRKAKKNLLYTGFSDMELNTSKDLLVIDEAPTKNINYFGSKVFSPDSTKVFIYHEKEGRKKEPNTLIYKVYNADISGVIQEGAKSLPIKSKNYYTDMLSLDNNGNVYVLAKVTKEKKSRVKGFSDFFYKLIVFGIDNSVTEFDFDYENNDIASIEILASDNGNMICTGFLKPFKGGRKKKSISDEMFVTVINSSTLEISSSKKYELEGLYPEKMRKSSDYVPYKVRHVFSRKDGGSSIVAEQYKMVSVTTSKGYRRYYYYYCDVAIINVNASGDIESVAKIPKYQLNATNPSIIATHTDGNTYVIYEDLTKNNGAKSDKKTKRSTGGLLKSSSKNSLFLITVPKDGKYTKELLLNYKTTKIRPSILSSIRVDENKIMFNANDQIGLMTIGE